MAFARGDPQWIPPFCEADYDASLICTVWCDQQQTPVDLAFRVAPVARGGRCTGEGL